MYFSVRFWCVFPARRGVVFPEFGGNSWCGGNPGFLVWHFEQTFYIFNDKNINTSIFLSISSIKLQEYFYNSNITRIIFTRYTSLHSVPLPPKLPPSSSPPCPNMEPRDLPGLSHCSVNHNETIYTECIAQQLKTKMNKEQM